MKKTGTDPKTYIDKLLENEGVVVLPPIEAKESMRLIKQLGYTPQMTMLDPCGWGNVPRMAVLTAVCTALLGIAIFLRANTLDAAEPRSFLFWPAVSVGAGSLTIAFLLSLALFQQGEAFKIAALKSDATAIEQTVNRAIVNITNSLVRMAERWSFRPPSREEWEADAANYLRDFPALIAVEWASNEFLIEWTVPEAMRKKLIGQDLAFESNRREALLAAAATGSPRITRPIELLIGGRGALFIVPVRHRGQPNGILVAPIRFDMLFQTIVREYGISHGIIVFDGDQQIFSNMTRAVPSRLTFVSKDVPLPGTTWRFKLYEQNIDAPFPTIAIPAFAL